MNKITLKRLISNSKYTVGCITLNINDQEQIYWTLELVKYDKNEGKETEVTAHSFL